MNEKHPSTASYLEQTVTLSLPKNLTIFGKPTISVSHLGFIIISYTAALNDAIRPGPFALGAVCRPVVKGRHESLRISKFASQF